MRFHETNLYTCSLKVHPLTWRRTLALSEDGYYQIRKIGDGREGYISFANNVERAENMGLMLDGGLIALQENVTPGETVEFKVTPTYYCGF